jgi:hypothetical protein
LTFNIKLHKEADNVSVSLRPESDVAPVPVQTSNATIAITLSPPATTTREKTALDNHGKKKPILYLHAGPPKTATSTIQAKLFEHQKNLSKDGIVFLGRAKSGWYLNSFPHVAHCPMYRRYAEKADGISPNCFSKMNVTLQSYYHSGKDIIISNEVVGIMYSEKKLAKRSTQAMQDFADLVRDWDVRILLGYRPYFDFVISQFNEQWEIKAAKVKMNRWPKNGGKSVPLVKDSWSSNTGLADGGWPATADMADFFSKTFANVTVFDITNPGDLSTHFFCNILENANEACAAQKALVASGTKQTRVNVANPLDYDMLATAASAKGLFSLDLKRSHVAKMVQQHHEDTLGLKVRDFPLICPSLSHTMALFNATVDQEEKLVPGNKASHSKLETTFQKRLATMAFCNVDVEKVLAEEAWIDFFKSL